MGSRFDDEVIVPAGAYIELVKNYVARNDMSSPYSLNHTRLIYNSLVDNWCTFSFDCRLKEILTYLNVDLNKRVREKISSLVNVGSERIYMNHSVDLLSIVLEYYFLTPEEVPYSVGNSHITISMEKQPDESKKLVIDRVDERGFTTLEYYKRRDWRVNGLVECCKENMEILRLISLLRRQFYSVEFADKSVKCLRIPIFTKDNYPGITKTNGLIAQYGYTPVYSNLLDLEVWFQGSKGVKSVTKVEDIYT